MNTSKINWFEVLLFKGSRRFVIGIITCLIISAYLGSWLPPLMTELSRYYSKEDLFFQSFYALLYILIATYINRSFYQFLVNKYVKTLVYNVRNWCYQEWLLNYDIQTSKSSKTERYPQGEVLARIMNDTDAVRELITSGTFAILINLFFVISCLVSYVKINKTSGLFLAGTEILAAGLLIWGSKYMRKIFLSVRQSRGNVFKTVANVVGGLHESYYTRHENYASKKGEVVFDDFLSKQLRSNIWDASYYSLAESLYPLLLAMLVFIFPMSKITEAAILLAVVDLIQRSINPIKNIAGQMASLQRAITGFQRIGSFLGDLRSGHASPLEVDKNDIALEKLKISIPFFKYPKRTLDDETEEEEDKNLKPFTLENISFEGKKGELLGLVGLSGCGKSTLLNIIASNIIPENVDIHFVSDKKENDIHFPGEGVESIAKYREQVGIVSQDSHIFSESLLFNITMQKEAPSDFSKFWDWILEQIPYFKNWGLSLEDKLDQQSLSVGQKQLLAAVRACYLKKPIVLFDEISSALDSELEYALRKAVLLVQQNSLTIIVAHRLETITGANNILVLEHGRLVSEGQHGELMESSSVYRQFIDEISHS